MIKKSKHLNKGFTLIEVLVAMVIGIAIALLVASVSLSALKEVRMTKRLERLHSNATYISNTIGYLMKQSADFDVKNPTQAVITSSDLTTNTITLSGTNLTNNGTAINSTDVQVTSLTFTSGARSLRVNFTLKITTGAETFSGVMTVAQRNSF